MRVIRFENRSVLEVGIPEPALGPGEALVRVLMAGICATDIAIFNGYADFRGIPGHEFAGVVEKCPDRPELEGKRVVADINFGCGRCADEKHCKNRSVLGIRNHDGAFAQYCAIPAKNLYPVPEEIETRQAVFAEPLAAALAVTCRVPIDSGSRIAVLGDGCLGILCAAGLRQYARSVTLLGRHPAKMAAAEKQGINIFPVDTHAGPEDAVSRLGTFDITVDATGNADGINWCIHLTRPKGHIVVKTTAVEPSKIDLAAIVVNELSLMGSRCGDLPLALNFLQAGKINVEPLVSATYPFSEFKRAFSRAMEKETLKILIDFSC